ncbi:iron-hydroxamate ABC transporter substrate-binding protein [Haloplasma contractile]|uniref:Iron compound ABC transporter iron compound-binding protein n=1 Tax=Haloplasma contractile SSD-17B TaxID=1033810 RepID=F7Q108_9MOLU|nr:iron-hydroxamate ABC transporter substrate-binding protein [Haloplasma contractile]ERJ11349.1 Iron compound ABC transporter iron compound-binding protein [Haloplasma contractile SSD-17B]
MKKLFLPLIVFSLFLITACGTQDNNETAKADEFITYQSEEGQVEVPANPERIVVLNSFISGYLMALDMNIVGVDGWSMSNPNYAPYLENAVEVSDQNLEKIIELNPDLIIVAPTNNNIDQLKEIAPTVSFTYGALDYLTTHIEVGKLVNKESEATTWVNDFKDRAKQAGSDIKAEIGENATVSVFENYNKALYVFGNNFARGTEILYGEMELAMPEKVQEVAANDGFFAMSVEVIPEYAGDYIILTSDGQNTSFQETDLYKNIPAVKNNQVYTAEASRFFFNDPITLDYQLEFFIDHFLGE